MKSFFLRQLFCLLSFALVASVLPDTADARPRPHRKRTKFVANKGFGIGLMLGTPTGLSGKWYLGRDTALDFGIGRGSYRYSNMKVHMDILWHPWVLAAPDPFWVPIYLGIGGRFFDHDYDEVGDNYHLGLRLPLGVAIDFNRIPLDIFFEFAFVIDVIRDEAHGYSDLHAALGLRYYLN